MTPHRPPPDLSDLGPWLQNFRKETDRAAAVLGGALLDELLAQLFRARLARDANPDLLGERGALGSFAARIDLAYALGWISPVVRDDLHIIRAIRNDFAHAVEASLIFEDQSISARTRNLKLPLGVLALAERRAARKTEGSSDEFAINLASSLRELARARFETAVAVIAGRIRPDDTPDEGAVAPAEPWDKAIRGRSY